MRRGGRSVRLAVLAVLAAALVLPVGAATVGPAGASAGAWSGSTARLAGFGAGTRANVTVAPAYVPAPSITAVGAVPADFPLTVAVGLAPQDPSGLSAYLGAEYGEGTPAAGAYLTPTELADRYGATASSVATAADYFSGLGLSVTASPDRLLLFVSGPSDAVARAFGTSFVQYRTASDEEFFSHPTAAVLPDVAPWTGVLGLANDSPILPSVVAGEAPVAVAGPAASCTGYNVLLTPCEIWNAYDMTPMISNGINGTGLRIGIVDAYSSEEDQYQLAEDLATFDSMFGVPNATVHFVYPVPSSIDLNTSGINPNWQDEDVLDLEWAHAAAPGATIDDTLSPNSGVGLYEAIDWLVAHHAVDVISLSWGEPDVGVFNSVDSPCSSACNASTDGSYAILSPILEFAAAEGISVFAASGDCGAADGTSGVSTNYPASDPSVTGVGGTMLNTTSDGMYLNETAWSGNRTGASGVGCANQGGSGGGYAPFARPWWQVGLPSSPDLRGVPDVALDAAPTSPAVIVTYGSVGGIAGTSLGTPIWAGIAADLGQSAGRPLGFLDPTLYRILNSANYSTDFHPIVYGNNGYAAGPGWNPVTGIGTPIVAAIARDLGAGRTSAPTDLRTSVVASPASGATPLAVAFSISASGGSGAYPLEGVSFGDGTAALTSTGSVTHVYARAGVYAAQSYVADSSGNVSASAPALVVAGGEGVLVVRLTVSTPSPPVGGAVTFTATASGGTAPYWYSFYFGDGTFANNTTVPTVDHPYGAAGGFCASVLVADSGTPAHGGRSAEVGIGVGGASPPACASPYPALTILGGPAALSGSAPLRLGFAANVTGGSGGPYGYAWSFGDGGSANTSSPDHTFDRGGTYHVELTVSDMAGDLASDAWNVTVRGAAAPSSLPVPWLVVGGAAVGAALAVAVLAVAPLRRRPPARLNP